MPGTDVCNALCNATDIRRAMAEAIIEGDDDRAEELRAMLSALSRPKLRVVR
jgi:hypothetical protein